MASGRRTVLGEPHPQEIKAVVSVPAARFLRPARALRNCSIGAKVHAIQVDMARKHGVHTTYALFVSMSLM